MTPEELVDLLVAAVPDLAAVVEESLADHDGLVPHVLMGDVAGWCEDHVVDRRTDVARIGAVVADALEHGDDRTGNVALVSFSEGIFPGTPLWDVVPEVLRDTWSGVPGGYVAPVDSEAGAVTYCERWDRVGHVPHLPLTEEQARERFEHGPWFSVVLPYVAPDDAPPRPASVADAPDCVLEIEAGLTTVTAVFFDDDTGDVLATYTFRRDGDVLLFAAGIQYEAPEDGRRGLSAVVKTQEIRIQRDGAVQVVVDERADDDGVAYADSTVDVAGYLEPVPAFGAWASLARYDR